MFYSFLLFKAGLTEDAMLSSGLGYYLFNAGDDALIALNKYWLRNFKLALNRYTSPSNSVSCWGLGYVIRVLNISETGP